MGWGSTLFELVFLPEDIGPQKIHKELSVDSAQSYMLTHVH